MRNRKIKGPVVRSANCSPRQPGLAFHSWLYISLFAVFILALVWLLQIFFLSYFYQGMRTREIVRAGERITSAYGSENFESVIQELSFRDGLMVTLLDGRGIWTGFGLIAGQPQWMRIGVEFERLRQSLDENNTRAVHFVGGENDRKFVVYMSRLETEEYLLIVSMLPAMDSTVAVLNVQFRFVAIIAMCLSLIAALIAARVLSAPIIALTKSAKKLAEGDLSVKFTGEGYSEIRELADTLNYATDEISKSERYRNELVANVSHDLRTPLTLIKFYGEMIRDVTGTDEIKRAEACDTIIKEADWLTEMVNEILELSKSQLSDEQLVMEKFNISACLEGIIETVKVMVERDGYILELDIDKELTAIGSEQGLKRAMYNLIGNALNYTGEDKRVKVSLKPVENGVRFEVADTGKGLSEDEIERVWDRYYKSGEAHKRPVIGTGIGLSIVKAVLDRHHAECGVKSKSPAEGEARGAVFWFVINHD